MEIEAGRQRRWDLQKEAECKRNFMLSKVCKMALPEKYQTICRKKKTTYEDVSAWKFNPIEKGGGPAKETVIFCYDFNNNIF